LDHPQIPEIPGYQIEAEIGVGGMGIVYRARHLALDRVVALKVIHPRFTSDPEFVRSFATEAKIVAKLAHPNIVSVYDFGSVCDSGVYYLSMQYVLGQTVRDLLAIRRPKLDELASIVRQVGDALDYAHRQQVVHRDIKTGNILLCPDGKAMVIDFGIAHGDYSVSANSVWAGAGTRSYMSPEQCKGYPATPRSDQYSLGVGVYEMLAGRLPFIEQDPQAVMRQHVSETPPPLSRGRTDITPRMETAVLRALSKTPEMRFASVGEFAREMETACREAIMEPIAAAAPAAVSATLPASGLSRPALAPLAGGGAVVPPPRPVANGWVYATRGGRQRGRRSLFAWALVLLLLAGAGAGGYVVYARQLKQTAAAEKLAAATAKHPPAESPRRRARRSARRQHSTANDSTHVDRAVGAAGPAEDVKPISKTDDSGEKPATPGTDVGPEKPDREDPPAETRDESRE
jgi:hypothetical protein